MLRNPILPLAGVIVALGLAGCAASPLYVPSTHRGTVGEIPRDGNGEPMWDSIPRPLYVAPSPNVPPAPGIPITGPGVLEMRVAPPPAYAAPVPITGPGVAEMRAVPPAYAPPVYAPPATYAPPPAAYVAPVPRSPVAPAAGVAVGGGQPLYAASAGAPYVLSPLSPDASPSEVRKRARDRRRACAHLRDCPADIRP